MSFTTYLICLFLMFTGSNELEISNDNVPKFDIKYENHTTFWVKDAKAQSDKHGMISALSVEDRIELCNLARKFVGFAHLDVLSPGMNVSLKKSVTNSVLLECDTIPVSYLRPLKGGKNNWDIVMDVNPFTRSHNFDVEMMHTKPISCADSIQNDPLYDDIGMQQLKEIIQSTCFEDMLVTKSYMVSYYKYFHFMDLCIASKEEIIRRKDLPVPVFQSREFEPLQKYDFKNVKRVALQCPTFPLMYVYLKTPRLNKDVQIVLVPDPMEAE